MYKEKINKLVEQYKEDKEVVDFIYSTLSSMAEYLKRVTEHENAITILRFRLEPDDYRIKIQELDTLRKRIHDSVIAGVKFLNRISNTPIYEGDVSDRYAVGEFAKVITMEIFDERS